jgi:hypothetical protein
MLLEAVIAKKSITRSLFSNEKSGSFDPPFFQLLLAP